MGILDNLRAIVGGAATEQIDDSPAEGTADDAVRLLVDEVQQVCAPKLRDGCTETYLEAVLQRSELDACVAVLTARLGDPAKPFGARAAFTQAQQAMVDSRGGIDTNQCLFLRRHADGRVAFAALWPWGNGVSITLKVGVYDADVTPAHGTGD